ncbi:MAG: TlyA family RNA methyltransferase [Bacillota bacterium]
MGKIRLDMRMVELGLVESREKAKALIMAGQVKINNIKAEKAGTAVDETTQIEITGQKLPYVSRGGLKLEQAIKYFALDLKNKIMADIGASTGGFTDCALQYGVDKVYAVDVGYGQLDWKLRTNPRVINMERTNARYITIDDIGELLDLISIDVAFISLEKILPALKALLKEDGIIIALIKPQFEAGRENIGKKGVVRDPDIHIDVIKKIVSFSQELGMGVKGLTFSPVTGPEGNIEYLVLLDNTGQVDQFNITSIVKEAHEKLNGRG